MPEQEQTALSPSAPLFDLIFTGRLLPGSDARQARLRLTAFFQLSDPTEVEPFFRGSAVTLRRGLPEKTAQQLCERLVAGGLACRLLASPICAPNKPFNTISLPVSAPPPNLFQIRSDRPAVADIDRESSQLRFLAAAVGTTLAGSALVTLLLARLLLWTPVMPVTGPDVIAATADGRLYMLAGNRLLVHNRAGSSVAEYSARDLGLENLHTLLSTTENGAIFSASAPGQAATDLRPWQCSLADAIESSSCVALTSEPLTVKSLAASELNNALFAIDDAQHFFRINAGHVQQQVKLSASNTATRVIHHRGLLMLNNSEGPGIGIYRPDAAAFGQQLDEILLLHPEAIARDQHQVLDFSVAENGNWALLTDGVASDLYRFNQAWAPAAAVALPELSVATRIVTWRDRLLVYTPGRLQVERINAEGMLEAPLLSTSLASLAKSTRAAMLRKQLVFPLGLLALVLLTLVGGLLTWMRFHRRESTQQPSTPEFLLEHRLHQFCWLMPDPRRTKGKQSWTVACLAFAFAFCLSIATGLTALTAVSLPTLLFALAARYCLALPAAQIGTDQPDRAVVDHRGIYQTGSVDSFQTWGPFVYRGGVIVCTQLPGIPGVQVSTHKHAGQSRENPMHGSLPGHPAAVLELLLQSHHPLLLLALSVPTGMIIAAASLALSTFT